MVYDVSLDAFSETLQKLYGAANGSAPWRNALCAIEELTGSAGATLNLVPTVPSRQGLVLAGRFTEDVCEEYARDYMAICPRTAYAVHHMPELFYDFIILDEAGMDRDPVYDWFGKLGLRYHIGTTLPSIEGFHVNFSLQRARAKGHVQASDIALFNQLKGHIGQAVTMYAKLGASSDRAHLADMALDRLPSGIIAVGENREILYANYAAERILTRGMGLRVQRNILGVADPNSQKRFASLVSSAAEITRGGLGGGGGWISLDVVPPSPPMLLFVAPAGAGFVSRSPVRPSAIIFIHDRDPDGASAPTMLRELFGLTSTEAQMAVLLGRGDTLDQAAQRLGHGYGTARNHLKSIFAKTDMHSQQDLVRLIATMVSQGLAGRSAEGR